jgi:bifunctional enzyme CysN/CysC
MPVTKSPLRIFASGPPGSGTSTLVARLRAASNEFLLTDAHEVSVRELVEGFSTADVALIVVDATRGSLEGAWRNVMLAALTGVGEVVLVVNKMDAVENAEVVFQRIENEVRRLAEARPLSVVPVSATFGHNVVEHGPAWYQGLTISQRLQLVAASGDGYEGMPFRMPVALVESPGGGSAGTIVSGRVRKGDAVRVQGRPTLVARIVAEGREVDEAVVPDSVALGFSDAFDVTPGDVVSTADRPAELADQFEATVVWLDSTPLLRGRNYLLEIGKRVVTATIGSLKRKIDPGSAGQSAPQKFEPGEIGVCNLRLDSPVAFDPHRENPRTGSFRLIDPTPRSPQGGTTTRSTVGVGALHFALRRAQNVHWQAIDVNKGARSASKGQRPCVLWYTGLSGAGKSTIANLVDKKLHAMGRHTYLLDGDNVRHGLNKDLGFTAADRVENIRRIAEVAKLMVDAGLIVGTAFISPFRAERSMARGLVGADEFIEIFVDTPLGVAEERDPKGLYKKARRGELKNFTGIDSPYEAPENPDLRIDTTATSSEAAADLVVSYLEAKGILDID